MNNVHDFYLKNGDAIASVSQLLFKIASSDA